MAQGADLSISPVKSHLDITAGETATVVLTIKNHAQESTDINFSTQPLGEQLPDDFSSWVSFSQNDFSLDANAQKEITAQIKPAESTQSGAYTFALMVGATNTNSNTSDTSVNTQLASRVLVNYFATSDDNLLSIDNLQSEALEITSIQPSTSFYWPNNIAVTFELKNTSKYYGIPHGLVRLTDKKGLVITQAIINPQAKELLPQKTAEFLVNLEKPFLTTGEYSVEIIANLQEERPAISEKNILIFPWLGILFVTTLILFTINKKRKSAKIKL